MKVYTWDEVTISMLEELYNQGKRMEIDSKRKLILVFEKGEKHD